MADFPKVMKEYKRMCSYYDNDEDCSNCPFHILIHNLPKYYECDELLYEEPILAEDQIMRWSREHPPKVYPFVHDVVRMMAYRMGYDLQKGCFEEFMDMRLNEDTAKMFGIEPINECTLK